MSRARLRAEEVSDTAVAATKTRLAPIFSFGSEGDALKEEIHSLRFGTFYWHLV